MRRSILPLCLSMLAAACSGPASGDEKAAVDAVEELQGALRQGDRERCRELVTSDSTEAIPSLPWRALRTRRPVTVRGVRPRHCGFFVDVTDPNDGGRSGTFVVVPEYGRYVVDLIATAGLTAHDVFDPDAPDTLAPRTLTPADRDRIHDWQLAQPLH